MKRIRNFNDYALYKFTFTFHYILLLTGCHNWTPTMIVGHVGHANKTNSVQPTALST